ncbi:MAG: CBS domain-containing protein [Gammaproteobacteria bacterium]|nr:CBS domain-containing protein [Gammaproteobacteria bacterium]
MGTTSHLQVKDVMGQAVITLQRNDKLSVADDLMKQKHIRHIPVLDENGKLCGIVTQRDLFHGALLKALGYGSHLKQKMLESLLIKEAMTNEVRTTSPESSLAEAARVMLDEKIGCLPVVNEDKLVGLLTEADFLKLAV